MEAKPRPLLGSLLGLLLGIVVVALLWQLGVVPPDQLVLFGVLAVTIFLVTSILTQRVVLVRKRFILVTVLCGLMAGVAVAGIPDMIAGGSISDGCFAEGTSSLGSKTPDSTSVADPFDMTRTDSVAWTGESVDVFTDWKSSTGIDVGGFPVEIWSGSSANEDQKQSNSGVEDVSGRLADIEESTGIALAGIYHVYGNLDANEGGCDMSAYVRLPGEGVFAGTLNLVMWGTLAALIVIILIMAGVVRHSITRAAFPGASASGAAAAAATDPSPTENRAKESAPRAESGRETKPESRRPEPQAKDKPERAWRQEPGRDEPDAPDAPPSGDDKPEV
ncbi:MAG TPA: hypothetical protein VFC06_04810 [Demequina sp.]|nr:hypothetical protein [Demequina sp.]